MLGRLSFFFFLLNVPEFSLWRRFDGDFFGEDYPFFGGLISFRV